MSVNVEYEDFFAKRLAELRMKKNVSARAMSLDIGQGPNYINAIETKKNQPSMEGLYFICDYFGITPKDFFDEGNENPQLLDNMVSNLKKLDQESMAYVAGIAEKLAGK